MHIAYVYTSGCNRHHRSTTFLMYMKLIIICKVHLTRPQTSVSLKRCNVIHFIGTFLRLLRLNLILEVLYVSLK